VYSSHSMEDTSKLALETIELKKQAIIFLPSRASAEKTAEDLSKLTSFSYPDLEHEILHALSIPTKQCKRLSHCIKKGIAFHHSGLTNAQKELIEESFRQGKIKIICATPTLAAGLSLPVFRVIIKSLKRYNERWGMEWIPVLEYLQMAGRAGRPEYEKYGESIVITSSQEEKEEIYNRYICGVPEDIYSKLAAEPILRTHLLSLISSGIIQDSYTLRNFFAQTFWAKQFNDFNKLEVITAKILDQLKEWQFISIEKSSQNQEENTTSGFVSAKTLQKSTTNPQDRTQQDKIPQNKIRATTIGKRISELYLDPLTAKHLLESTQNFNETKKSFSLFQMISHTLELRPLLSIKKKDENTIQEELNKKYEQLLEKEPSVFDPEYEEFMNSIKTALFFEEWIDEKDEDYLLEKYDIRPGEIRVKLEIADWLLYGSEELAHLQNNKEAVREIKRLRLRLEYGVKEELLALLKLKGIGRIRARKLYSHGLKDIGDIKKTDQTSLSQILGKALAEDIKKQVGEEIKEIPKGTRKGQLSINKF